MPQLDEQTEREALVRELYGAGYKDAGATVFGKEAKRPVVTELDVSPTVTAENSEVYEDAYTFHANTDHERPFEDVVADTLRMQDEKANHDSGFSPAKVDQFARNLIQRSAETATMVSKRQRDFMSDVGVAVAALSPLAGGQQALYGFMSGEGWGALNRVWPTVVMEDSEGVKQTRASAALGLEILRDRFTGKAEEAREKAAAVLDASHRDFRSYVDVLESNVAGYGPVNLLPEEGLTDEERDAARIKIGTMLNEEGPTIGKFALAAGCGVMDVFCDPLLLGDGLPVRMVNAARKGMHPTSRAVAASKIANRVGRVWDHTENLKHSKTELEAAQIAFERSGTRENALRLGAANSRYVEAKHLEAIAVMDAGPHETIITNLRVKPDKIIPKNYVDEVVSYSPTRGVSPESRKATMLDDIQSQIDAAKLSGNEDAERAMDAWSRRYKEVSDMAPEDVPTGLTSGGARTKSSINAEINDARRAALGREYQPIYDWTDPSIDPNQLEMRTFFGPDMAEEYSEALRMIVAGADPDDVLVKGIATPEYMAAIEARPRAVTPDGKIDMAKINEFNDLTPDMADMTRRGMKLSAGDVRFDMRWLPDVPKKNPLTDPDTYDKLWKTMSDRVAPGLYPLSTVVRPPAMVRASANLLFREPLRVLDTEVPGAWKRVRNALREVDFERDRMIGRFQRLLKDAGALSNNGKTVNEKMNEKLFDILNTPADAPEFAALMEAASPEMRTAARQIRGTLEFMAEKQGLAGTADHITGYIPHVISPKMFAGGAFPPDMHGISPKSKLFIQHLIPRSGADVVYPRDAASALDIMARGASRKLHLEPALDTLLTEAKGKPGWYRSYTNMLVANLKGQPSTLGKMLDHTIGTIAAAATPAKVPTKGLTGMDLSLAEAHNVMRKLRPNYKPGAAGRANMAIVSAAYSSALTGNARYPWMAIGTGIATTSSSYGALRTQRALFAMGTAEGQLAAKAAGIERQWAEILESPLSSNFATWASRARVFGPSIMDTEYMIRGLSHLAAADDLMTRMGIKTWDEALEMGSQRTIMAEAARVAEETNHFFGVAGKPPIFGRTSKSGAAAATQFLSFIPKQTEELAAQAMRNPGYIGRYLMMSGWIQRASAEQLGIDMGQYVGFGYMPSEAGETTSIAVDVAVAGMSMMNEMNKSLVGKGDLVKTEAAIADWIEAQGLLVPAMQAGQQIWRRAVQSGTGEVRDSRGLRRNMDIGDFDPSDPSTYLSSFGDDPAKPTEMFSIISQVESVQHKLERENNARMRQVLKDEAYATHRLSMALTRAVDDGNMAEVQTRIQELAEAGFKIPDIGSLMEAKMVADALERNLRIQIENPELTIPFAEAMRELKE